MNFLRAAPKKNNRFLSILNLMFWISFIISLCVLSVSAVEINRGQTWWNLDGEDTLFIQQTLDEDDFFINIVTPTRASEPQIYDMDGDGIKELFIIDGTSLLVFQIDKEAKRFDFMDSLVIGSVAGDLSIPLVNDFYNDGNKVISIYDTNLGNLTNYQWNGSEIIIREVINTPYSNGEYPTISCSKDGECAIAFIWGSNPYVTIFDGINNQTITDKYQTSGSSGTTYYYTWFISREPQLSIGYRSGDVRYLFNTIYSSYNSISQWHWWENKWYEVGRNSSGDGITFYTTQSYGSGSGSGMGRGSNLIDKSTHPIMFDLAYSGGQEIFYTHMSGNTITNYLYDNTYSTIQTRTHTFDESKADTRKVSNHFVIYKDSNYLGCIGVFHNETDNYLSVHCINPFDLLPYVRFISDAGDISICSPNAQTQIFHRIYPLNGVTSPVYTDSVTLLTPYGTMALQDGGLLSYPEGNLYPLWHEPQGYCPLFSIVDIDNDDYFEFVGVTTSALGYYTDERLNTRPYIVGNIYTDPYVGNIIQTNSSFKLTVDIRDEDRGDNVSVRATLYYGDDNNQTMDWINLSGGVTNTYGFFWNKGLNKTGNVYIKIEWHDSHSPTEIQERILLTSVSDGGTIVFGMGAGGYTIVESDEVAQECLINADCVLPEICINNVCQPQDDTTGTNAISTVLYELGGLTNLSVTMIYLLILLITSFTFISYASSGNNILGLGIIWGGGLIIGTFLGLIGAGVLISIIVVGVVIGVLYVILFRSPGDA